MSILTATALALVAGRYAISSIRLSGIYSSTWTDADLIRARCPIPLIQPEWVSSQPDTLLNWYVVEMRARLGLIAVLWLTWLAVLLWRHRNKRHIILVA